MWSLPVVALVGGVIAGARSATVAFSAAPNTEPALTHSAPSASPASAPQPVGTPAAEAAASPKAKARNERWTQEAFVKAASFPSTLHRRWALKRFFDSLSLDQFPTAVAEIEKLNGLFDRDLKFALFRSWAEDAPDAALRSAGTLNDLAERKEVFGAAIRAWGRRDVSAATAWAEKNLTGMERTSNLNYLNALALRQEQAQATPASPEEELKRALQETDPKKASALTFNAYAKWADTDPAAAAREAMKLPADSERSNVLHTIMSAWIKRDRRATTAFLDKLADRSLQYSLRETILDGLNYTDPKASWDFALLLPAGRQRIEGLSDALTEMYSRDPDNAVSLYESLPDADKQGSFGGFLKAWKQGDAKQAAEALLAASPLPPDATREAHSSRAQNLANKLKPWIQKDAKAVGEMALALPDVERADVLYAVAQEWCQGDAAAAGTWAAALPAGPARDEAMKQFTFTWAKHDASKVTAWLNQLPADSGKSAAATGFAFSIFDTDPDAALSWTRVIRDEPERMKTLGNAWRQWRSKNSSAATSWLEATTDLSEAERAALQAATDK